MTRDQVFFNAKNDVDFNRVKEITNRIHKQMYITYAFWIIIILVLTLFYYFLLDFQHSPLRNLIYAFLFAIVSINWFFSVPFLGVMLVITIRTKSRNFFFQLFPNLGMLITSTVVTFSSIIKFNDDNFGIIIFIGILLILIVVESILLRMQVQGVKENKKPLFFWTFFQDTLEAYTSTILTQQALRINEQLNGYSERPFFSTFSQLREFFPSSADFRFSMEAYAVFLTEKSELIEWDVNEHSITLYPRVLLGYSGFGVGIRYLWHLFFRVLTKKGMTSIIIDYELQELSIRIAKEDYFILNEVTYHLLGLQLLERFKQSIKAFMENNQEKSYSILFT